MAIWVAWLLLFPPGLWLVFHYYPPLFTNNETHIFGFLLLICIVSVMPMTINGTTLFCLQGVSLAVFLTFGLAAELVLTQFALLTMLLSIRLRSDEYYRLPLNSLMFFSISLLSGYFYYLLGGTHDFIFTQEPEHFWLILAHQAAYFIANQILITMILLFVHKRKRNLFGRDLVWETVSTIIVFPIGLILFILYQQIGLMAIAAVGIPLISLALIMKLYYSSKEINEYLQKASEFGHELTQRLQVNEVLDLFIQKISTMLPVDYAYILDVNMEQNELHLLRHTEKGIEKKIDIGPLKPNEGISGTVWQRKNAVLFHSRTEWNHIQKGYIPDSAESVLSVPIMRNTNVTGVLVLASNRKREYHQYQLMIVDILCSYLAVAYDNARYHEETKKNSERCALTKLYNYRYFEGVMEREFKKLDNQELKHLSLILLDLDRFKIINDTYGHESGNEILRQMAVRIANFVGETGITARYGGEEFVILLPDIDKENAFEMAETIRQAIAFKPFEIYTDLDSHRSKVLVTVTASIGVASAPADAEDFQSLIRHADRAMYTGAKKAGRNKVAQYAG
ncbi:GGDEF domain-containing protein [Bacillus sp. M6-12]|nr:GGDEF domain-containing protein [Bacillus sp. M6-12]